jgi:hypothetical protein
MWVEGFASAQARMTVHANAHVFSIALILSLKG